jgi:tachykinin-like receptor
MSEKPSICYRYIAIIYPLRPRLTGRIVLTIIVCVWAASIALALPNIIYAETYVFPQNGRTICYLNWPDIAFSHKSEQDLM